MATTTTDIASKAAKFREMAKDKALPQDVRNAYLDKANKLEEGTMKPTMAKGGSVVAKAPAKKPAVKGPAVVIAVGMAKPSKKSTMMNKGGMAKKGKC
jgi:hypothetical protein